MRYEGKFFIDGEFKEVCIEVDEHSGKIVEIKKSMDKCEKIKGALLPGAIDLHVHFREPGYEYKEDFYSGSLSAAFGGVTFVADMPNTKPRVLTGENFRDKLNLVSSKSNVDFTLYAELSELSPYLKDVTGMFKWYMYERENVKIPENSFISVHAELKDCIGNADNLKDYDNARPSSCETRAVRSLLNKKGKFHIAHISSVDSVDMCKIGGYTCEVTPHHLFFHRDMDLGPWGKVNPPLRAKWLADKLWNLLVAGRIDIVASDHAPHTIEEKEDDFSSAPPGIPEVETYVPIFLYLVKNGKISMKRAVEVLAENPARLIRLKKGRIEKGYDADFIAVDFTDVHKIHLRDLHYKCNWTPYENFKAISPHTVVLRGEKIIDDRELIAEKTGRFISSVLS